MAAYNTNQPGDRLFAYLTLTPAAFLVVLLVLVPSIVVVVNSFQSVGLGATSGPFVGFDNYQNALADSTFFMALRNTFVWVFGSVAFEMLLGLGVALMLHRSFKGRGLARVIVLTPYLLPTIVAILVWRYMFNDLVGIVNALLLQTGIISRPILWLNSPDTAMMTVILVGTWKYTPFVVIAILGILQSIPQEQYEAATIDGASQWQQFWRITLPHILPVFLLTALLRTIWAFQKFDIIYILTGGGPLDATTTLPILIYLKAFVDFDVGRAAAVAVILMIMLLILIGSYALLIRRSEEKHD